MTTGHDDQERSSYPKNLDVVLDAKLVRTSAVDYAFLALRQLDINRACAAIASGAATDNQEPLYILSVSSGTVEQPVLHLCISIFDAFLEATLDPAKFDRTNPEHEELLQRCARILQEASEAPESEDFKNPRYDSFECWRCMDGVDTQELTARWTRTAEIWAEASKPA